MFYFLDKFAVEKYIANTFARPIIITFRKWSANIRFFTLKYQENQCFEILLLGHFDYKSHKKRYFS